MPKSRRLELLMISVGANPGPSSMLTHPGPVPPVAMLHVEGTGNATLSTCTLIRFLAAQCTELSLASTEAEVPSGYMGVDLAAHFGPCKFRLGFVSLSRSHLSKKSKPKHSRHKFKFSHSQRVDPPPCKHSGGQAGEAATSWQTGGPRGSLESVAPICSLGCWV